MSENFAELFEASHIDLNMRPGSIITARVIDILRDMVVVDARLKSEGFIPISQFMDERGELEVSPGDEVEVALDMVEDGYGETRLSRDKAKRIRAWSKLEEAHRNSQIVQGIITDKVKGGFTVEIMHLHTFLPGSQVDVRPVRDIAYLEGKLLDFKVIKIDQARNNVVVSRRAVLESENLQERQALLEKLKEGMEVQGTVKNMTDYGAFLDLQGIDGLLHITDMAWRRVKHPKEVVSIGDVLTVKVLKFDRERSRVSLGLKQMGGDPWANLIERHPVGTRISGKVTNLVAYGCFVELEEGVEGLVHVSEMDWINRNILPSKVVHVGDEVEVCILDIDEERRRISLGMKQCQPNPWEEFAARYNKHDRVVGTVKSITDFGVFIGLENGIDGLAHMSDLSWLEDDEEVLRKFHKGDQIESVILSIDIERERISLGIKQLQDDPFSAYVSEHGKGSVVNAVVKEVHPRYAILMLAESVTGRLKSSEISRDRQVEDVRSELKEGGEVEVKIVTIDRKQRSIAVSMSARDIEQEKLDAAEYAPDTATNTKLGDILKGHLDDDAVTDK